MGAHPVEHELDVPVPVVEPVLDCRGVGKSFAGVPVLRSLDLALAPGTVTALAGENGAGKSTLMKIASGQYRADAGSVRLDGEVLPAGDVRTASRRGVAIVPQELAPISDLTVYENMFVGRELTTRLGTLDRRGMVRAARELIDDFEVDIDARARMGSLPVGLQQIVEIIKNTSRGARVLLLDEPTSAIAEREVEGLYRVVTRLRERGVAVAFTTHKMAEIRAIADRVVVLRDGRLTLDSAIGQVSDDAIVAAMIGRELEAMFPDVRPAATDVALEVSDLVLHGSTQGVSLTVRRGEILGLAGLVGAGRTELIEGIFGNRPTSGGAVSVAGRRLRRNNPASAIAAGMALVPEDRKRAGAVLTLSVLDNGTLPHLSSFDLAGVLRARVRVREVGRAMESVRLRSSGLGQPVGTLSGGNQQKVVLARWLTHDVDVLLLDEPTRGVDVGARSEIYRIVADLAASGMAVVMASSDMPEILGLAHRSLVMRAGRVVGDLTRAQLQGPDAQDLIFRLASGLDVGATAGADEPAPQSLSKEPTR